jgi:hypothetical protein
MPIATLLTFLPQFITAGEALWDFVKKLREAAQQSGEWDADHEAQFQAALIAQGQAPESQPDPK